MYEELRLLPPSGRILWGILIPRAVPQTIISLPVLVASLIIYILNYIFFKNKSARLCRFACKEFLLALLLSVGQLFYIFLSIRNWVIL